MKYVKDFFTFWYHFIIGDDYRIALGVIIGFAVVGLLVHKWHAQLWWLLPVVVVGMLALSLWLETRKSKR